MQGGPLLALTATDESLLEKSLENPPPRDGGVAVLLYVANRQLRLLHRAEDGTTTLELTTALGGGGVADGAWHHFVVACVAPAASRTANAKVANRFALGVSGAGSLTPPLRDAR